MVKEANKGLSKLKNLSEYVALAVVNAKQYQKINIDIIKEMVKAGTPGVYVTLNRPYDNIKKLFDKEKIDTKNVIFIDIDI